jgi:hypothetical protein
MRVMFSFHAAQRLEQRLNATVDTRREVNIESSFVKVKTYEHNVKGIMVEAWVSKDIANPVVLIIGKQNRTVMTVLTGTAPFVAECYALYKTRVIH